MAQKIFAEIKNCQSSSGLFDLTSDYFLGQGFGGICYIAPSGPAGPVTVLDRGIPADFIARYREQELYRISSLPGLAFRLGHPEVLENLVRQIPRLSAAEKGFVESLRRFDLTDSLIIPSYGPTGRPGILALARPAHPSLVREMDQPLAAAVAQQVHSRMASFQVHDPPGSLSPREREILRWLCQGKSGADIATILGLALPTVTTHIQRIYGKLRVHDRVNAVTKAMALHYI